MIFISIFDISHSATINFKKKIASKNFFEILIECLWNSYDFLNVIVANFIIIFNK